MTPKFDPTPYRLAGIPRLCRLKDFARVSRQYAPGAEPNAAQLDYMWKKGVLIGMKKERTGAASLPGRWVDIHATLHAWGIRY